jgi:hypothetical protein
MHGHQLRLLAEEEHVALWTDITVGSLYGAIKRLAAEELNEEVPFPVLWTRHGSMTCDGSGLRSGGAWL